MAHEPIELSEDEEIVIFNIINEKLKFLVKCRFRHDPSHHIFVHAHHIFVHADDRLKAIIALRAPLEAWVCCSPGKEIWFDLREPNSIEKLVRAVELCISNGNCSHCTVKEEI